MKDWEVNPDDYLKDENGNFILKVDGTPKKRGGRKITAELHRLV